MSIDELRAMQDREGLRDRHLVYVDVNDEVLIAHTDHERALAGAGLKPLDDCPIERWLRAQEGEFGLQVTGPGIFKVVRLFTSPNAFTLEPLSVMV